jgi:hypothetical protein
LSMATPLTPLRYVRGSEGASSRVAVRRRIREF